MPILPNVFTICRLPLAILFLFTHSLFERLLIIFLAGVSDGIDGFLARRYGWHSRLGTLLDPIMDKLFVSILLYAFWMDGKLQPWEIATFLSRDMAVLLFGAYLWVTRRLGHYEIKAIWCGKLMTLLQFLAFACLVVGYTLPESLYFLFVGIGILSFIELMLSLRLHVSNT